MAGPGGAVMKPQGWGSDCDLFNAKGWGRRVGFQQDKMGEKGPLRPGGRNVEIQDSEGALSKRVTVTWKEALALLVGDGEQLKLWEQRVTAKAIHGGSSPNRACLAGKAPRHAK